MSFLSPDTSPDAAARHSLLMKRLGPEARVRMAFELSDSLRATIAAGIRSRHPDWNEGQVRGEMIRLTIGDQLYEQTFAGKGAHG